MNERHGLLLFLICVHGASVVSAQCGLNASIVTSQICTGLTAPEPLTVHITAGVPPFTVKSSMGQVVLTINASPPSSGGILPDYCDSPFTIEDGNGCTTTNIVQDPATFSELTAFEVPVSGSNDNGIRYDCQTGNAHVRIRSYNAINVASFFEGFYGYSLVGPINETGTFSGLPPAPTPLAPSARDLIGLPPGDHTITMFNNTSTVPNACSGAVFDCGTLATLVHTFTVPPAPFTIGDCGINVTPQIALEGAMPTSGTLMNEDLRVAGMLPLTEPYTALGYSFVPSGSSGASVPSSMFTTTGNNAIVDWVVVEIRDGNSPFAVIASRPALVQRDGDVVDLDGDQYVNFPSVSSGNYRIAVRHRNHLGIMQGGNATYMDLIPSEISLRLGSSQVYGTNATTTINGVKCLWSGNTNFDNKIAYSGQNNDRDPILVAIGGSIPTNTTTGYSGNDVNMDGIIKYAGPNNDRDPILVNIGGSVPTNVRMQQLP